MTRTWKYGITRVDRKAVDIYWKVIGEQEVQMEDGDDFIRDAHTRDWNPQGQCIEFDSNCNQDR